MSSLLMLLLLLLLLQQSLLSAAQEQLTIIPPYKHQTEGRSATFKCTAIGTGFNRWSITSYASIPEKSWQVGNQEEAKLSKPGFSFHFSHPDDSPYILTVRIVALQSNNNTQLTCRGRLTSGKTVNSALAIFTVESMPSPSDVSITALNDTVLVLSWEPPLIVWKNYSIEEYNVTVQNLPTSHVFVQLTTNKSYVQISLSEISMPPEMCQKFNVTVTAVVAVDGQILTSETKLTAVFPQFRGPVQDVQVIALRASRALEVSFEMPLVCGFDAVNYTIIINGSCVNRKIGIGPKVYSYNEALMSKVVEIVHVNHDLSLGKYCEVVVVVVTGTTGYISAPTDVFVCLDEKVHGSVQDVQVILLQSSPLALEVSFKVPLICGYDKVNYTIIINESCVDRKISIGPKVYFYDEALTSKVVEIIHVNHDLRIPLSKYCEVVVVVTSGTTEYFSDPINILVSLTGKGNDITLIIGASVGGSVALFFFLIAMAVLVTCYCLLHNPLRSLNLSQPPLVANPIYEGPLYETIENHLSSLPEEASSQVKPSEREQDTEELEEKSSTGSDRYLKNPIHFAKDVSVLLPLSFLAFLDASSGTPSPAASSDSGQAMTATAHLHNNADDTRDVSKESGADSVAPQATLVGTDAGATSRPAQLGMQRSDLAEDNYTMMSPVVSGVPSASTRVVMEDKTFP